MHCPRRMGEPQGKEGHNLCLRQDRTGLGYEDRCTLKRAMSAQLTKYGADPVIERHNVDRDDLIDMVALGFGLSIATSTTLLVSSGAVIFRPLVLEKEGHSVSAVGLIDSKSPALPRFLSRIRNYRKGF